MVCCTRRGWKGKSRVQHPTVKPLDLQNEPAWTKRTNGRLPPAVVLNECKRLVATVERADDRVTFTSLEIRLSHLGGGGRIPVGALPSRSWRAPYRRFSCLRALCSPR